MNSETNILTRWRAIDARPQPLHLERFGFELSCVELVRTKLHARCGLGKRAVQTFGRTMKRTAASRERGGLAPGRVRFTIFERPLVPAAEGPYTWMPVTRNAGSRRPPHPCAS